MPQASYFQVRDLDIDIRNDTAPKLGSLYTSLESLAESVNQTQTAPIPVDVITISAQDYSIEAEQQAPEVEGGVESHPIDATSDDALIYARAGEDQSVYRCERLETQEFQPDEVYIAESIYASTRAQNLLKTKKPHHVLYMITGLKIATGLSKSTSDVPIWGPRLHVGRQSASKESGSEAKITSEALATSEGGSTQSLSSRVLIAYRVITIEQKKGVTVKYDRNRKFGTAKGGETPSTFPWIVEPVAVHSQRIWKLWSP